jgi:hypothetical protein
MSSSGLKRWQYAFVFGVIILFFSTALVFGPSLLTAVAGAAAVVVGIINGLLSPPASGGPGSNWLLSQLKRFLNVGKFLKAATIFIWLASFGVGAYWAYRANQSLKESRKVTIEGLVLTAAGDPADKVVVTLRLSGGSLQAITDRGKFTFSKVDPEAEPSKKVTVHAQSGNRQAEVTVDLTNVPPTGLVLKLPPGDPPFRVTYFLLKRQAIDFLLQGKMDPNWEQRLAGQPFIVPNDVYRTLSSLSASFSEAPSNEISFFDFKEDGGGQTAAEKSAEAGGYNVKRYFSGSFHNGMIDIDTPFVYQYLHTLGDPTQQWRVFINTGIGDKIPDSFVLRKPVGRADFEPIAQTPLGKFYSFITKENMPPDFGYVDLYMSGGCSDEDEPRYTAARLIGRDLRLRVAVIENITNQAINLGDFLLKENNSNRLRSPEEEKDFFSKQDSLKQALYPIESLKPGEKILIPLEMVLGFGKEMLPFVSDKLTVPSDRSYLTTELQRAYRLDFPVYEVTKQSTDLPGPSGVVDVYVSPRDVQNILDKTDAPFPLDNEYIYGPSVEIGGVEIDRVTYPFRQFDPTKIVIYAEADTGSCPYVYTYSSESRSWLDEGMILYGKRGKAKESSDEKQLRKFDGRVLIRERDPEESFIDSVYVTATSQSGEEVILRPQDGKLRYEDGDYLTLRRGQQIVVDFDIPKGFTADKFILHAAGYYITYRWRPHR